jgi:hypothetical protein
LKIVTASLALLVAGLVAISAAPPPVSVLRPALALTTVSAQSADKSAPATTIAELINPAKLATLGQRGANPRVQKITYWLPTAQQRGTDPKDVAADAVVRTGYTNALAAQLTRDALLRNLTIATGYGCLDAAGMADMRKGQAPTIRRGKYMGDQLSVDHIVPRAVCPELDNVIANLELMPLRANESKNAKVGSRQQQKATDLHRGGLLSDAGLASVKRAAK